MRFSVLWIAGVLLLALPVAADEVTGRITRTAGAPVANARVILFDAPRTTFVEARDPVRFNPASLLKTFPPDSNDHQGCTAVTLLGNGKLLFVGGQKSTAFTDSTDRVKSFDTAGGTWTIEPSDETGSRVEVGARRRDFADQRANPRSA